MFDRNDAFLRSKVGQQWRRYYITDCINALLCRLLILIDKNKTLFNFDLRAFESEALRVRHSSDCNQQHLRFKTNGFALRRLTRHTHAGFSLLEFLEFRIDLRLDTAF